ncbi:MAG: tRNA nucleotidyltransferase, partial [Thermotoga sp.]
MKIITTHRNPDFDGFASCVAAKKLYTDHIITISGRPSQNLLEYLRIYGDRFEYITEKELEEDVEKIVLVDTSSSRRVGEKIRRFLNEADVTIYDHHPETENEDIHGIRRIEKLGATITMMVELLVDQGLEIDPIEATLFMIALYEDTGNLLYSSTTPRDIEVAKILLEKGANLEEVSNFVKTDLTLDQKRVAENLMNHVTDFEISGVKVSIAITETEKFIGGLNVVVSKLWSLG